MANLLAVSQLFVLLFASGKIYLKYYFIDMTLQFAVEYCYMYNFKTNRRQFICRASAQHSNTLFLNYFTKM